MRASVVFFDYELNILKTLCNNAECLNKVFSPQELDIIEALENKLSDYIKRLDEANK